MEIFNKQFNLDTTDMEIFYPEGKPDIEDRIWALETSSAGTSLGAPAWSAFISLINEYKNSSINNIHESLYKIAKSDTNSLKFRNSINNKNLNSNINKYNLATGLGSPLENNIYKALTICED